VTTLQPPMQRVITTVPRLDAERCTVAELQRVYHSSQLLLLHTVKAATRDDGRSDSCRAGDRSAGTHSLRNLGSGGLLALRALLSQHPPPPGTWTAEHNGGPANLSAIAAARSQWYASVIVDDLPTLGTLSRLTPWCVGSAMQPSVSPALLLCFSTGSFSPSLLLCFSAATTAALPLLLNSPCLWCAVSHTRYQQLSQARARTCGCSLAATTVIRKCVGGQNMWTMCVRWALGTISSVARSNGCYEYVVVRSGLVGRPHNARKGSSLPLGPERCSC
jgi:hypothetical protein